MTESAQPEVSVILPFHNAEQQLQRTLDSLSSQTLREGVEFVIVNDGSTDRSGEILNYFMALHPEFDGCSVTLSFRFRQGPASAFAAGVRQSRGRYVTVCVPGDLLPVDCLSALRSRMIRSGADVVCANGSRRPSIDSMSISRGDFRLLGKLFRREVVDGDSYDGYLVADGWYELYVCARALALSAKAVSVDVDGLDRATGEPLSGEQNVREHQMCALLLEQWFVNRGLASRHSRFLDQLKFEAKLPLLSGADCDVALWRETFTEVNRRILHIPGLRISDRLRAIVAARLPLRLASRICQRW